MRCPIPSASPSSQSLPPPAAAARARRSPTSADRVIPKSSLSNHFKVLRESGLIRSERQGVEMRNQTRCAELDERFPGLIGSILVAYGQLPGQLATN